MSITSTLAKLKGDQKRIEALLEELETRKKEVDQEYTSILEEEDKIHEELRKCRDAYEYSRLEMKLNTISHRRREIEPEKQAIERKIRGHREELEKVKARIEYMKPKGKFVSHKEQ